MIKEKRHSYIVVALIIAAVMIVTAIILGLQPPKQLSDTSMIGKNVRITGTALCLPHVDTSGPQTMECGIGILDDKGQYYALNLGDSGSDSLSSLPMNQKVTVEGTLDKAANSIYPIKGSIRISKIER